MSRELAFVFSVSSTLFSACSASNPAIAPTPDASPDVVAEPDASSNFCTEEGEASIFLYPPPICQTATQLDCVARELGESGQEICSAPEGCGRCWYLHTMHCVSDLPGAPCRTEFNCMMGCAAANCRPFDDDCYGTAIFDPDDGVCFDYYDRLNGCLIDAVQEGQCVSAGDVCIIGGRPDGGADSGSDAGTAANDAGNNS